MSARSMATVYAFPLRTGAIRPGLWARLAQMVETRRTRRLLVDRAMRVVVWVAFLIAIVPLAWILWTVLSKGLDLVLTVDWWTKSQAGITTRKEGGGAYHAIVGTLLMSFVTLVISTPIAIFTALKPFSISSLTCASVILLPSRCACDQVCEPTVWPATKTWRRISGW